MTPYTYHAIGNSNGSKTVAAIKSTVSYTCHAIGNCNGGKTAATTESPISPILVTFLVLFI